MCRWDMMPEKAHMHSSMHAHTDNKRYPLVQSLDLFSELEMTKTQNNIKIHWMHVFYFIYFLDFEYLF